MASSDEWLLAPSRLDLRLLHPASVDIGGHWLLWSLFVFMQSWRWRSWRKCLARLSASFTSRSYLVRHRLRLCTSAVNWSMMHGAGTWGNHERTRKTDSYHAHTNTSHQSHESAGTFSLARKPATPSTHLVDIFPVHFVSSVIVSPLHLRTLPQGP